VFIGRQDLLQRIQQYLDGQDLHPLVVHGVSGSGKSALVAKAVTELTNSDSREPNSETSPQSAIPNPQGEVVVRYIGATPASSDIRSLLEGLCREITRRYGGDANSVPMEYTKLVVEFPRRLALATPEKPLVVFLDALDQLSDADHGRNLAWLPGQLPEHVRFVVSTLPGECLTALEQKLVGQASCLSSASTTAPGTIAPAFLEVTAMTAQEGAEVLAALLHELHRTLQPQQRDEVLTKFRGCPYPLYLKLAFEEARRWKSFDPTGVTRPVVATGEQGVSSPGLSPDIPGILKDMFARLEAERNHGRMLVSRALGYLAASRHGLTEDELLDLLSADTEVMGVSGRELPISKTARGVESSSEALKR
jgi:hypothetical protein